jgi:hypothetical protein
VSLRILLCVLIACGARRAAAQRSISVEVAANVPVKADELVAAMRVRVATEGGPIHAQVTAIPDGVRVMAHGNVREVALEGLGGVDAARLIALAASDLFLDDLATSADAPSRGADRRARSVTLGMLGAAAGWDGVLGGVSLDAAVTRGSWLAAVDVTGGELATGPVHLMTGLLRADGGLTAGWIDLRAGLTVAPVSVSDGAGDRTVLYGGNASVWIHLPITSRLRAVIAGGADVFATRTEYRLSGMPATATPWWAPWLAVGVEVTP